MRYINRNIFFLLLAMFALSSITEGASYRKRRTHKGFKAQKTEHRIGEVKKKTQAKAEEKKRRPMQLEVFERLAQERMQEKVAEQIRTLNEIIQSTPEELRADLYFRLAEHYWENSKYYDFIGHRYDDYRGRPEWPEKARLQQQAFNTSKEYRKKAAIQYRLIIDKYPNYEHLCQAYYFLGKNLFDMGEENAALKVFSAMIQKFGHEYPKCPFIPNAYLAFGEHYFNTGAVRNALTSYQQVLNYRDTSIYGFALYKIAWCHYNLVQYSESLRKFVEVVRHAQAAQDNYSSQERRIQLLREALRDLVLAYSQIGEAEDAERYFRDVGGEANYLNMLRSLGDLYRQQGKSQNIITVYKTLRRLTPEAPRTMLYQLYITQAVSTIEGSQTKVRTIKETNELVRLVAHFRKRTDVGKFQEEADTEIRAQIKEFAQFRHYEGQKTMQSFLFDEAIKFYNAYLNVFGEHQDAYEMRFWHAELLYRLKRYEPASEEYTRCLKLNPKGKYSLDAAYNAVLGYFELMKMRHMDVSDVKWRQSGHNLKQQPLPPLGKKFLTACSTFLQYFPKGARAIDVAYKAAQMYYRFNHFDEALPRFFFLIENHPRHDYAMYSAHYILDTYNLQERWDLLNKWSWAFYRKEGLGNDKFKQEVRDLIVQSGIKICQNMDLKKDNLNAAKCFNNFAVEFPKNEKLASLALFNASFSYYKAKKPEDALRMRHLLIERYPKSQFVQQTILDLADIYAARADFMRAAEFYQMYFNNYPNDPKTTQAKIQSALYLEAIDQKDKSIDIYTGLIRDRKFQQADSKRYVSVYMRVAKHYKDTGNWNNYAKMMRDFDSKQMGSFPMRLHARMEYALTRQRMGARSEAEKIFAKIPDAYDTLPEEQKKKYPQAGNAAAHVRFMQAEKMFQEYTKIRLNNRMDQKEMFKQLKNKEKMLQEVSAAYERVVQYRQGEWSVAAVFRAGDLYYDYSQFLLSAPAPDQRDLEKEIVKAYEQEVAKAIFDQIRAQNPKAPASAIRNVANRNARQYMRKPEMQARIENLLKKGLDDYKMKLQEQAQPVEDQAVKLYQRCLNLGYQFHVYNKWTSDALMRLRKLRPYDYPQLMEMGLPQRSFSSVDFLYSNKMMSPSTSEPTPKQPNNGENSIPPPPPEASTSPSNNFVKNTR